jgi:hypothetical protein
MLNGTTLMAFLHPTLVVMLSRVLKCLAVISLQDLCLFLRTKTDNAQIAIFNFSIRLNL